MTQSISYQGGEISIYGWDYQTFPFLLGKAQGNKTETVFLSQGKASFTCPVSLKVGSSFTLKGSTETFVITSADLNRHEAEKK